MDLDLLIIGQGVCGTFLSREADRAGLSYLVIDDPKPFTASRAAAGIINPITGKRLVKTWIIDDLLPFALQAYGNFIRPVSITDFFPIPQSRITFYERQGENPELLRLPADETDLRGYFQYDFGYGIIDSGCLTDLPGLLGSVRAGLSARGRLLEEKWVQEELILEKDGVRYRDIRAARLVFCDGIDGFSRPWFHLLPFSPNKGEALLLQLEEPLPDGIFKRGISLVPLPDGRYWAGSSYEWTFTDPGPTGAFRKKTEGLLRNWLRGAFTLTDHIAAVRPATLERRPFVGFHPVYPALGILNGMGTKGCSLAPYFARQLAEHIAHGTAILPEADVRRFTRVLNR